MDNFRNGEKNETLYNARNVTGSCLPSYGSLRPRSHPYTCSCTYCNAGTYRDP